jgi:hypothetical protein
MEHYFGQSRTKFYKWGTKKSWELEGTQNLYYVEQAPKGGPNKYTSGNKYLHIGK